MRVRGCTCGGGWKGASCWIEGCVRVGGVVSALCVHAWVQPTIHRCLGACVGAWVDGWMSVFFFVPMLVWVVGAYSRGVG